MQYSNEFKVKVLATLGDNYEIRQNLEDGHKIIGVYLDRARYEGVSAQEIVAACESNNLQEIYQKAKRQLAIEELYSEWSENYRHQFNPMAFPKKNH